MKNLFLTIAFFSVLLLIGCQENSITGPASSETISKEQTNADNTSNGYIPLEGLLVLQGGFQSYYTIDGQISYSHRLVPVDPIPPAAHYYVEINLSTEAVLSDGINRLNISTASNDKVYLLEDGRSVLEKAFPILNSSDGLVLICRFLVTANDISLSEMQLEDGWVNPGTNGLNKNIEPVPVIYPPVVRHQAN